MSRDRTLPKLLTKRAIQISPRGLPMCRWCSGDVLPPKKTFCKMACVHEWRLRNDTNYMRYFVLTRDGSRCSVCGIDTKELKKKLTELKYNKKSAIAFRVLLEANGITEKQFQARRNLFDIDHIHEIVDGGGTGLDNYAENLRLLCIKCHKQKTKIARMVRKNV